MFSSVERTVSFFANLIAVVTFVAAALGWIDKELLPDYTPPTSATAILIILFYAVVASFGSAWILRERSDAGQTTIVFVALFVLIFCFSIAYLQGYLTRNLDPAAAHEVIEKTRMASIVIYMVIHAAVHFGRSMYPRGIHVVDLFTAAFRPAWWYGAFVLMIYLFSLPYLIDTFMRANPA